MECRICCSLTNKNNLINIFDQRISNGPTLRFYILLATGVEVKQDDLVSKVVCAKCLKETFNMFVFRTTAIKNDKMLKERAGQLYIAPKSIKYDPDKPIDFVEIDDKVKVSTLDPDPITSNKNVEDDNPKVSKDVELEKIEDEKIDSSCNSKIGTRSGISNNNTKQTDTNEGSTKLQNKNNKKKVTEVSNKSVARKSTGLKKNNITKTKNDNKKKVTKKVVSSAQDKSKVSHNLAFDNITKPDEHLHGTNNQEHANIQFHSNEIININSFEIEPHESVKNLFAKHPGLELSKELLNCNFEPRIKLLKYQPETLFKTPNEDTKKTNEETTIGFEPLEDFQDKDLEDNLTSLDDYDSLNKSLMVISKENFVYVCHICNEVFTKKTFLKTHMRTHYACKLCQRKFKKDITFNRHKNETCPFLYSQNDYKIVLTRCDENSYFRDTYRSAFNGYIKEEKEDFIVIRNESILNLESNNIKVLSNPIISPNTTIHSTVDSALTKEPLAVPFNGLTCAVSILENKIIINNSIHFAKKQKLPEGIQSRNKRKIEDVVQSKGKTTYDLQNTKRSRLSPTLQSAASQSPEIKEKNLSDLHKNAKKHMKRQENEVQFVKSILYSNSSTSQSNASTKVINDDLLNKDLVEYNPNCITLKRMSKELDYYNIPLQYKVNNLIAGVNELSARIEKNHNLPESNKQIDLGSIKPIGIIPLGSRKHKLPTLKKLLFRSEEQNVIVIDDDDDDDLLEVPVEAQVNNNTGTNSISDRVLSSPSGGVICYGPEIIEEQPNCTATQQILQPSFIQNDLNRLLYDVPYNNVTLLNNQGIGVPAMSSVNATEGLTLMSLLESNHTICNQSLGHQETFNNYQRVVYVQESRPSSTCTRPQIRIKKPSEINKVYA